MNRQPLCRNGSLAPSLLLPTEDWEQAVDSPVIVAGIDCSCNVSPFRAAPGPPGLPLLWLRWRHQLPVSTLLVILPLLLS